MANFIKGIGSAAQGFAVGSSEVKKICLGSDKVWPSYDAKIEYLKTTGSAYIDTLVTVGTSDEMRGVFMADGASQNNNAYFFFGAGVSYNDRNIECYTAIDGSKFSCCCNGYTDKGTVPYKNKIQINFKSKIFTIKNNSGTTIATADFSSKAAFTTPYTMAILALHRASYYNTTKPVRCYSFQILDANGNYIRDMIPVRVGQVGYMYDKVSGELFGNAGSGSFTLGPDL